MQYDLSCWYLFSSSHFDSTVYWWFCSLIQYDGMDVTDGMDWKRLFIEMESLMDFQCSSWYWINPRHSNRFFPTNSYQLWFGYPDWIKSAVEEKKWRWKLFFDVYYWFCFFDCVLLCVLYCFSSLFRFCWNQNSFGWARSVRCIVIFLFFLTKCWGERTQLQLGDGTLD